MKKSILIGLLVVSLLSIIVFGVCAAETTILRFATGGISGGWYATAAGLMQLVSEKDPTIKLDVVPGDSLGNCARTGTQDVDMAMTITTLNKSAFDGTDPFTEAYPDIRGGFTGLGINVCTLFVTKDTGLESVDDLINQKYPIDLVIEPLGSSCPLFLSRMLEFYEVDYATIEKWGGSVKFMGYDDQIVYMKDKHANAVFPTSYPASPIQEMIYSKVDLILLKFSAELRKYMEEKYAFNDFVIPKDIYGIQEEDITALGTGVCIIFNKNVPEDVVYRIIKIMCENVEEVRSLAPALANFSPSVASATNLGAPLHPGAEKYYKEVGWIK